MLAFGAAREKENGDVGAADQEERSHGTEKDVERSAEGPRVEFDDAAQIDAEATFRIARGNGLRKILHERLKLGVGLLDGEAGFEFDGSAEIVFRVGCDFERHVQIGFAPFVARRHDADNFVGLVDQLKLATDDVGIAHVVLLPELVGQNDDALGLFTLRRVRGKEPAAHHGGNAPVTGRIRGQIHGLDVFGDVTVGGGEIPAVHGDDALDGLGFAELLQLRTVYARETIVAGLVFQAKFYQTIVAWVRERIDQHSVDDAKDGAGGADAEGERKNSGEGKAGAFAKFAGGEAEVGEEG